MKTTEAEKKDLQTMRDLFACFALNGLLSHDCKDSGTWKQGDAAKRAYEIADDMIEARK